MVKSVKHQTLELSSDHDLRAVRAMLGCVLGLEPA